MSLSGAVRIVYNVALYPLAGLARLARRDPRRWVFGAGGGLRFADNAAWLFAWMHATGAPVHATWITRSWKVRSALRGAGLPVAMEWSPWGLLGTARAGVLVSSHGVTDVFQPAARGAFWVQLWHGIPIKHILHDLPRGQETLAPRTRRARWFQAIRRAGWDQVPDLLVGPNEAGRRRLAHSFRLAPDRSTAAGYPRLQALSARPTPWPLRRDLDWVAALPGRSGPRVLFLPTTGTDSARRQALLGDQLRDWTRRNDATFVVKLHPNDPPLEPPASWMTSIVVAPNELDGTILLAWADVLVTDISSAIFDMLSAGRPVVLVPYVWGIEPRGVYEDPSAYVATPVAQDEAQLVRSLDEALRYKRAGKSNVRPGSEPWIEGDLEKASQRVFDEIVARRARWAADPASPGR